MKRVVLIGLCVILAALGLAAPAQAAIPDNPLFLPGTDGGSTYDCFRIPSIVTTDGGDMVAFAEGRRGAACPDKGDIDIVSKYYDHTTGTWGPLKVVIEGRGATKGNPTAIWVPGTRRVVLLSVLQCVTTDCGRVPRVSISDDNGASFGIPVDLTTQLGFAAAPDWLALGPGHGIALTNPAGGHVGRLVAGMSYSSPGYTNGALIYSDDQGVTWQRGAVDSYPTGTGSLPPATMDPQEISVVELADGRVYAAARNNTNNGDRAMYCRAQGRDNRGYAISADGGETFYKRFAIEAGLVSSPVQGSVIRLDDDRILYAGDSDCARRKELRVRWSDNEGCSWQGSVLLWGEDVAYTDMAQVAPGEVRVLAETGPTLDANATISLFTVTSSMLDANSSGNLVTPDTAAGHDDSCLEGTAALTTGKFGSAATFDGGGYVHVPLTDAVAAYASDDFTWSGWFTAAHSSAAQALVWAYSYGADRPQVWIRVDAGGKVHAYMENGPTGDVGVVTTGTYDDGAWHHVAATRSAGTLTLYVDGTKIGASSGFTGALLSNSDFTIALAQNVAGGYRLQGKLDEVRFYKRALTTAEIATLANSATGAAGTTSGLTFHLPFDSTRS